MVVSLMVLRLGRPIWPTLVPMILILTVTVYALFIQLFQFYREANWFLLSLDVVVLVAAMLVILEVASALSREFRRVRNATVDAS